VAEPVAFSHKRHRPLALACALCHPTVKTAERAGFPTAERCMSCHRTVKPDWPAIQKLAAMPGDARIAPALPVYRVADFVFFSHGIHVEKARVPCEVCHGQAAARDKIVKEVTLDMKFCVDCHRAKSATIACNACHELNQ
jgi:hypothetical protein